MDSRDEAISLEEVRDAILSQKNTKASGLDKLPAEVLKMVPVLLSLHTCSMCMCLVVSFRKRLTIPIPMKKNDDLGIRLNYRGITLLSVPCKIIVCNKSKLENHESVRRKLILSEEQNSQKVLLIIFYPLRQLFIVEYV